MGIEAELKYWKRHCYDLLERNLELVAEADNLRALVERQASALEEAQQLLVGIESDILSAIEERWAP